MSKCRLPPLRRHVLLCFYIFQMILIRGLDSPSHFEFCVGLDSPTHFEFCGGSDSPTRFVFRFRGRKYQKARSEKCQWEYYENLVAQNNMRPIAASPPLEDIVSNLQEEYDVVASPLQVALPDPTAEK